MFRRLGKRIKVFLITVLLATALMMGVSIFTDGMYLLGVPAINRVERVIVSYPGTAEKEITDPEQIELAVKLTGFLRYVPFKRADKTAFPSITITYFTNSGGEISVTASSDTVWWNGKPHAIKKTGMFIKVAEGIFFLGELQD